MINVTIATHTLSFYIWILPVSLKVLSEGRQSHPSSTFLLFFRLPLHNHIVFITMSESQVLYQVCGIITVPHGPLTQITHCVAAVLTGEITPLTTAFIVNNQQCEHLEFSVTFALIDLWFAYGCDRWSLTTGYYLH